MLTCDTCGATATGRSPGWYVVDTQTQCPAHRPRSYLDIGPLTGWVHSSTQPEVPSPPAIEVDLTQGTIIGAAKGSTDSEGTTEYVTRLRREAEYVANDVEHDSLVGRRAAHVIRALDAAFVRATTLTGCCKRCGTPPKIEAGPVNDTTCISVDAQCACHAGFNLWPRSGCSGVQATPDQRGETQPTCAMGCGHAVATQGDSCGECACEDDSSCW